MQSQKRHHQQISLEFFPPKSEEGTAKLNAAFERLQAINPSYVSVTYGAGGTTQQGTLDTVLSVMRTGTEAAPHLSCIGSTRAKIRELLDGYLEHGIRRIVALRGDMPSGMLEPGEFRYASELVEFMRAETGRQFHIEVAAYPEVHPQTQSAKADLHNFKRKVDAGADGAITQYFYNPDAYFRFVDSCERIGLTLPIVPGIMPITNYKQLARFSDACGAEIPRWVRKRLEDLDDDTEGLRSFGLDVTTELCRQLLTQGAPGLHFYTMNQAGPTLAICRNLGFASVN